MENMDSKDFVMPSMAMSYSSAILPSDSENRGKVTSELTRINCQQLVQLVKDSNTKPLLYNFISTASQTELESILKCISMWNSCDVATFLNDGIGYEVLESLWNNALSQGAHKYKNDLAHKIVGILREGKIGPVSLNTNAIMFVGGLVALVHSNGGNKAGIIVDEVETALEAQPVDMQTLLQALNNVQKPKLAESLNQGQATKRRMITPPPSSAASSTNSSDPSPNKSPRKAGYNNQPEPPQLGYCSDETTLKRREKELQKGKDTIEYKDFIATVPKANRIAHVHPRTPNKDIAYSRRAWDGLVKQWRISLHTWKEQDKNMQENAPPGMDDTKNDKTVSGCAHVTSESALKMPGPPYVCTSCKQEFVFPSTLVSHGALKK